MIDDEQGFEQAVEWFTSLSNTQKAQIIDEFGESELLTSDDTAAGFFFTLVTEIRNILSASGEEQAIQRLTEKGMSHSYAVAFVEETVSQSPPTDLVVQQLDSLSEEDFKQLVDHTVEGYVSNVQTEELLEEITADESEIGNMQSLIQTSLMSLLRGEASLEQTREGFQEEGLSEDRANYICDKYEEYAAEISEKLQFGNIQSILFDDLRDIKERQRRTNQLLEELLRELQSSSGDGDRGPPRS